MKIYLEKSFEIFFGDENKIWFIYFIIIIIIYFFCVDFLGEKVWVSQTEFCFSCFVVICL